MEPIYAYHITDISNIKSILTEGIVPNIGENNRQMHEHHFLTYFTTLNCVDTWINRFHLDKNRIVILKFLCKNYERRYDSANDFFTYDSFLADDIMVVEKEEKTLKEYYENNKEKIELELNKSVLIDIKFLKERLDQIEFANTIPETGWDYIETEPNLVKTIDLLKKIRCLNNKSEYKDIVELIKEKTLKKLIDNDLEITTESELYKTLNIIFNDCLLDKSQIDIKSINIITKILSINLFYRQLDRYHRTQKKYGDDNTIWQYDRLPLEDIQNTLNNETFKDLLNETITLYNKSREIKKL